MPVPFPRLTFISGEGLAPYRVIGICSVPAELHNNGSSLPVITGIEITGVAIKRTDNRCVESNGITIGPVNTPEFCFGIEQAESKTCKWFITEHRFIHSYVSKTIQYGHYIIFRFKFHPLI